MQVYLASGNPHKLEEFVQMARDRGLNVDLKGPDETGGMPEVVEDGDTFEENARIKAQALLERVPGGAWVLADDSGLLVDALDGAPGVQSARFAGPCGNAAANNIKLLHLMREVPLQERTARFRCVLCFMNRDSGAKFFEGECEGEIITSPSGEEGFGYDPLFRPAGYDRTFADLGNSVKNSLSHRGRAVAKWAEYVRQLSSQDATG